MRDHGLFQPDVLIAEMRDAAERRSASLSSEKRLMLAVLHDAFDCYQKYLFAIDREGRQLFEGAAAWINCTSKDHLFSFESITEALDIEPNYFRRGLAEWHKRHVAAQRAGHPRPPTSSPNADVGANPSRVRSEPSR